MLVGLVVHRYFLPTTTHPACRKLVITLLVIAELALYVYLIQQLTSIDFLDVYKEHMMVAMATSCAVALIAITCCCRCHKSTTPIDPATAEELRLRRLKKTITAQFFISSVSWIHLTDSNDNYYYLNEQTKRMHSTEDMELPSHEITVGAYLYTLDVTEEQLFKHHPDLACSGIRTRKLPTTQ